MCVSVCLSIYSRLCYSSGQEKVQGEAAIFQACKNSYASAAPSALLCSSVSTRPAFASQPAAGRSPAMSGRWGSLSLLVDSSGEPIRKTDGRRSERRTGLAVTGPQEGLTTPGSAKNRSSIQPNSAPVWTSSRTLSGDRTPRNSTGNACSHCERIRGNSTDKSRT